MKKILTLCTIALSMTGLQALSFEQKILIDHVKKSVNDASTEQSKITPEILALDGMSSSKGRHLLNNLCTLPSVNYLEIGVGKGSTFISALYNNPTVNTAIAIDNWTGFGIPRKTFFSNINKFLDLTPITVYEMNAFKINKKIAFKDPINIYFYDGEITANDLEQAFTYFNDIFADTFIAVVDDFNMTIVQEGTKNAFNKLGYNILFEQFLPADYNGDTNNWWNGVYVAVINKNGPAQPSILLNVKG